MVFRHLNGPMVQPRGDREKTGYTGDKKATAELQKKYKKYLGAKTRRTSRPRFIHHSV
jgi:hypothetical protein